MSRILSTILLFLVTASAAAEISSDSPPPTRRIALTFDDAPRGAGPRFSGHERTETLIGALSAANTGPVAFFVKTANLDRAGGPERIDAYASAGHLIANHTHSHAWLNKTDTETYIGDIEKAEALLNGFDNRRAWFRYPFLDEGRSVEKRAALVEALRRLKLQNAYVTVDNYDWYIEAKWQDAVNEGRAVNIDALRAVYVEMLVDAADFYDQIAARTLPSPPAHVLLLHENDVAAMFVGDLVAALRKNGWKIISPDEAYKDALAEKIPMTLKTGQGRVAALAIDAGLDPRTLTHLAIEEEQIDQLLIQHKVFGAILTSDQAPIGE